MSHWFHALTARRLLRRRRWGQGLVEYSLIVTSVAFVAMVGLNVVGKAEEAVLRGEPLAAATPAPGFFAHTTNTTLNCGGGPGYIAGNILNCTARVDDTHTPVVPWAAPGGDVRLWMGSTVIATCAPATPLAPIAAHSSQCTFTPYTFAQTDSGPHNLVAEYYTSTTTHSLSSSQPPWPITVTKQIRMQFASCLNLWTGSSFVAVAGQPLKCQLYVDDPISGLKWPSGEVINLTSVPANGNNGLPAFSCFTANRYSGSPVQATITNPSCAPSAAWTCVTDLNGFCATMDQPFFEYRRLFDDGSKFLTGSDVLTASAPALGGQPQNSLPIALTVGSPHAVGTGAIVNCSNYVDVPTTAIVRNLTASPWTVTLNSDQHMTSGSAFTVSCTASVMDLDPNTTFDHPDCTGAFPMCDIDYVDAHAPLGTVTFSILDKNQLDAFGNPKVVDSVPCTLGHLLPGLLSPFTASPTHLLAPPVGQVQYASWCSMTYRFTPGAWRVVASYSTPTTPHNPSPPRGSGLPGFAAPNLDVDI